jgi:peptidoglycan/xylan/chitin deacetylase (PgdA/CDA1 family)
VLHQPLGRAALGRIRDGSPRRVLGRAVTWCAGHAPVLMYHGIGCVAADPFGLFISPERFGQQMEALSDLGLQGVSLGELGDAVTRRKASGLVGITFDDAYREVLDRVPPVLERYGFTATVFAVSELLGGVNVWDPPPRRQLMAAADLRDLAGRGLEVGSHGANHVRLSGEADRGHGRRRPQLLLSLRLGRHSSSRRRAGRRVLLRLCGRARPIAAYTAGRPARWRHPAGLATPIRGEARSPWALRSVAASPPRRDQPS